MNNLKACSCCKQQVIVFVTTVRRKHIENPVFKLQHPGK